MNNFFNPAMLLGLLGLSLPILVHLISKRRYDVVQWGAMQFLELGRNQRRKLRLEQLLLMLLRMALIALIVFALARPWVSSRWFSSIAERKTRDVVLVIDGSYSMGFEGGGLTPHQAAVRWAHRLIDELNSSDTVMLIDSRDQVRTIIPSPSHDLEMIRKELDEIPSPSGTSDLSAAVGKAVNLLSQGTNTAREIVVLTDGQALGWHAHENSTWARVDEAVAQAKFPPRIWVADMTKIDGANENTSSLTDRPNYVVDRIELSRETTVPSFPVRIQTKISRYGADSGNTIRQVDLEIDGQRLADQRRTVSLSPGEEETVEFTYRFPTVGSHLVSIVIENDALQGDNRADAVIVVENAFPVLLIDGDPSLEPTKGETFFLRAALTPSVAETPLIQATAMPLSVYTADPPDLSDFRAVVLADVPQLADDEWKRLEQFVETGGGLFIALGDQIDPKNYNARGFADGEGLIPYQLTAITSDAEGANVLSGSLDSTWLTMHRQDQGGELHTVRFLNWWKTELPPRDAPLDDEQIEALPTVAARLETGDPLLIEQRFGSGRVVLATSPTDLHSGWNTLAARRDVFVPLLHELIFYLAGQSSGRNTESGYPLSFPVAEDIDPSQYVFRDPADRERPPTPYEDDNGRLSLRLIDTDLPGVYRLMEQSETSTKKPEYFVVNFDRSESDLTPLTDADRLSLERDGRLSFLSGREELVDRMYDDAPNVELFRFLMLAFLVILVGEVFLTRQLVQGGHAELDDLVAPTDGLAATADKKWDATEDEDDEFTREW
ncbi:BatA domain-containing protein [Thalassoroseus pseudoceratinae]|uniref:BatA domain-containing protein n=1 Tax=Thalassoroseus pseudoceratinae TaxID=2713176 RepID=UPI00141E8FD6|nr:BatA domain-containing protein [Thalassoroseus pseudoceratinae]